jgi:hypothetical protein
VVFGSLVLIRHFHKQSYEAAMLQSVWQGSESETSYLSRTMYQFGPTSKNVTG